MTTQLTAREVVRLHQMAHDGFQARDIAKALQVNRNSVTAHLAGDITYPPEVARLIPLRAELHAGPWLTVRQAAPWIPGHPSMSRMWLMVNGRTWLGRTRERTLKTERHGRRVMTRLPWIRQFVRATYPPGIWISIDTLEAFTSREIALEVDRRYLDYQLIAAPLIAAENACQRITGEPLALPTLLVHRALKVSRHIGTAVV